MDNRVQVFMADSGQHFQAHALKSDLSGTDVVSAAIDRDVVTSGHQPSRKMFSERLEAAVVGRDSPGT